MSSSGKTPAPTTPEVPTAGDREKEAEEVKRLQEFYLRNQSVFIKKNEFIAELNMFYSTDQETRIFAHWRQECPHLINTRRRFYDTTLFGRAGIITDGLELDIILCLLSFMPTRTLSLSQGVPVHPVRALGISEVHCAIKFGTNAVPDPV